MSVNTLISCPDLYPACVEVSGFDTAVFEAVKVRIHAYLISGMVLERIAQGRQTSKLRPRTAQAHETSCELKERKHLLVDAHASAFAYAVCLSQGLFQRSTPRLTHRDQRLWGLDSFTSAVWFESVF
eukprot:1572635-Rhodomonas_salina.1